MCEVPNSMNRVDEPGPDERSNPLETIVSLRDGLTKACEAILIIEKYNHINNDLQAYLHEIAEWGLGEKSEKPNPKDYGLGE